MPEAIPILHPPARTGPVMTLAKFYARKRVVQDFQAAGIRYRELGAAQISLAACAYLSGPNGPELIARATETLAEWAERDRQRREMRRQRRLREKGLAKQGSASAHSMRPSASHR
jgi:hypothetical protein